MLVNKFTSSIVKLLAVMDSIAILPSKFNPLMLSRGKSKGLLCAVNIPDEEDSSESAFSEARPKKGEKSMRVALSSYRLL